jgi:hypothetical protein
MKKSTSNTIKLVIGSIAAFYFLFNLLFPPEVNTDGSMLGHIVFLIITFVIAASLIYSVYKSNRDSTSK